MNGASRGVTAAAMAIFAIAGLASVAMAREDQAAGGQPSQGNVSSERLVIKTKSTPPVVEPQPIGVNEPGVNMASRPGEAEQGDHHQPSDAAQRGIDKKDIRQKKWLPSNFRIN